MKIRKLDGLPTHSEMYQVGNVIKYDDNYFLIIEDELGRFGMLNLATAKTLTNWCDSLAELVDMYANPVDELVEATVEVNF